MGNYSRTFLLNYTAWILEALLGDILDKGEALELAKKFLTNYKEYLKELKKTQNRQQ